MPLTMKPLESYSEAIAWLAQYESASFHEDTVKDILTWEDASGSYRYQWSRIEKAITESLPEINEAFTAADRRMAISLAMFNGAHAD